MQENLIFFQKFQTANALAFDGWSRGLRIL